MFAATGESVGESSMVTNVELAKEVDEKREKNRLLEVALQEVKTKLDEVFDAAKRKEEEDNEKCKEVAEEDVVPEPEPILN